MLSSPGWRGVLLAEKDGGFRAHVQDLTARGLRALGYIGPAAIVLYIALSLAAGRHFTLGPGEPGAFAIWDKLVILLMSASLIPLSRIDAAQRAGRWIGMVAGVVAAVASVMDDIGGVGGSASSAWVALFLVVVTVALPLNPKQVILFSVAMILAFLVPVSMSGEPEEWSVTAQFVFLFSVALSLTVVSILLYRSRLDQYRATEHALALSEDLAEKARRIENLERMKSRFFMGITHDIRTPLSLVVGPVNDLIAHHEGTFGDATTSLLHIAHRNARKLSSLVDDLLDLAQIEADQLQLHVRPRDLGRLLDYWVLDLQPLAERQGVTLSLATDGDGGPIVASVDPDRMAQVVQNLVTNAIAHTPRGGHVRVRLGPGGGGFAQIRVEDEGSGIPADILPHVFDRFYRAEIDGGPGYGLGLAIARELTELHDGRIDVESEPGAGSVFTVQVPSADGEPEEWVEAQTSPALPLLPDALAAPAGPQPPDSGLPHVLVVDDNDEMRRYLRFHLDGRYRVTEATRGDEALDRIREDRPDLVLSDVVMPGLDGFGLCRAIRAEHPSSVLPIVLLTARSDTATLMQGSAAGADDVLVKPFDAEALTFRLENLIEGRRMLVRPTLGPTEIEVESSERAFLERVREVVEDHLADSNFGVDWLADEVALSARQLQRRLRASTRLSAAGFIRMLRLGRAAQLLAGGATNVSETAYAVGFRDVDHFTRIFRQTYGVLPSEYARRAASGEPPARAPAP
jgi:signal transduction histidine kinase/DNA-binding NarL/FixJ family response regulator